MSALIKYDEACRLLAEARAVDEVVDLRSKADAMRHYARQAKNRELEIDAAQIRVRAERRLGELVIAQKETDGLNKGRAGAGRPSLGGADEEQPKLDDRPTLEEVGIDRKLSSRAQKIAGLGEVRFEALMNVMREQALAGEGRVIVDILKVDNEANQRNHRRDLARNLSEASAALPIGRKYPVIYADPPWSRKQGVTNRSYENHYTTMSWDEICALPIAEMLLPDAWLFLWIPRAHLLALHPVPMEFADDAGVVITRTVKLPLAWAIARAWGCDAYSSCHIWTKTDEDHPDAAGTGLIWRDQNEVLLLFKRGRGLPMPEAAKRYGSNHSERPREHSRKPDFYREMIADMTGGLPVLELFARVDEAHPLPAGWSAWGNQSESQAKEPEAGAGTTAGNEGPSGEVRVGEAHAGAPATSDDGRDSRRDGTSFASRVVDVLGDIPEFLRRKKTPAPSESA